MSNIVQKIEEKLPIEGHTNGADADHTQQPDRQAGASGAVGLGVHSEPLKWHTELHDSNRPEHRYGEEHYGSPKAGYAGGYAGGHKEQYGKDEGEAPAPKHHEGLLEKVKKKIKGMKQQQEGAGDEGAGSSGSESDGEGGRRKKRHGLV